MRAHFEVCLGACGAPCHPSEFLFGAPARLIERLHPKGFGDVGDRFREAV